MEQYYLEKGGINFQINITLNKDFITIGAKININDNIYSLDLKLKELQDNYEYFQKCNSLEQAFQLLSISFEENKIFIDTLQNSGIILGINTGINGNIFFNLVPKSFNSNYNFNINLYQQISNYNNINNNIRIKGGNTSNQNNYNININEKSNPMLKTIKNIIIPEENNHQQNNNINDNSIMNNNKNNSCNNDNNDIINNKINIDNNKKDQPNVKMNHLKNEYIKVNNNNSFINVRIFEGNNINLCEIKDLTGFLKICLIKQLTNLLHNKDISGNYQNLKDLLLQFENNIHFTGDSDINLMIKENKLINILFFSQYLKNSIINTQLINKLINQFLNIPQKRKINNYWRNLLKYEKYNSYFELQFIKDLKKCKFDYSIISINLLEKDNSEVYEEKKKECPNCNQKLLYHISNINPFSLKKKDKLKYSVNNNHGNGFYFLDSLDNIPSFYDKENNVFISEKIIPVNSTFSFIASEIFYDKNKINTLEDINSSNKDLNDLLIKNQKVENNGLNIINIYKSKNIDKKNFLYNEYVISEEYQILPLYTITLRRNEYCVLWRDPNFEGKNDFSEFLRNMKQLCIKKTNMNFYYETSTEEALKFILRRKYDKVILITSIGKDLSGKRFIEVARKIYGIDIIVLFFSNNMKHLEWIQNFNNCLYTNKADIYEQYITNFNESSLKNLKKKVEEDYNIKLKPFSFDFILFPNYKKEGDFNALDYNNHYIRTVNIKNGNNYLCMTNGGNVIISKEKCLWDIIIFDNEITMFSNGFYLWIKEDKENVIGYIYMKRWNFDKIDGFYYFMNKEKNNNNILSFDNGEVRVNKGIVGNKEIFELIDNNED